MLAAVLVRWRHGEDYRAGWVNQRVGMEVQKADDYRAVPRRCSEDADTALRTRATMEGQLRLRPQNLQSRMELGLWGFPHCCRTVRVGISV
eukprot:IDg8397t1